MSSPSRPPETYTFFVDRSLGKHVVAVALRSAGARVEVHDDHFSPDATDEHWLTESGEKVDRPHEGQSTQISSAGEGGPTEVWRESIHFDGARP